MDREDSHFVGEYGVRAGKLVPQTALQRTDSMLSLNRSWLLRCSPCGSRMFNTYERTSPRHNHVAWYRLLEVRRSSSKFDIFPLGTNCFPFKRTCFSKSIFVFASRKCIIWLKPTLNARKIEIWFPTGMYERSLILDTSPPNLAKIWLKEENIKISVPSASV